MSEPNITSRLSKLSVEEKNKIITEKLFGLKVIYPKDYYKNLKGKNADYWRDRAEVFSNDPVIVKGNKPLKTHSIDSRPMPDFYSGPDSADLINQALKIISERNLHQDYARTLAAVVTESLSPGAGVQAVETASLNWELINSTTIADQADAIVLLLLEDIKIN